MKVKYLVRGLLAFILMAGIYAISRADSSPSNIVTYNGTGANHNSVVYKLDYSGNETLNGSLNSNGVANSGNGTVSGSNTVSGNETVNGLTNTPSVAVPGTGVTQSSTIIPTSSFMTVLASSAGIFLMNSKPTISTATTVGGTTAWPDGTQLVLASTGCLANSTFTSTVTVQSDFVLSGTRLNLGATNRAISCNKSLTLIYTAVNGFWNEISYANNP